MKKTLLLLLIIIIVPFLKAYNPAGNGDKPYVEGEIMVKLYSDMPYSQEYMVSKVITDFPGNELALVDKLSDRLDIFLLAYDPSSIDDERMLENIKAHPFVELAQFNHYLEQRDLYPNDIDFIQQWNMHNTGQNSGTVDADIDGPEAWGLGTSSVTATGDSIVVAIVDDGFDLEHPDLRFWKNYDEIPGNGIDDDQNGYIDDFDGWNPWQNTGQIIEKDHGTHVTGIAAARGNNGIGVTGVSMNAKVMPIVYGNYVVESIVVAGYSYIHEMRSIYNETDGDEGAFVVSTNASFGTDNAFPEDFPIWAAIYDSLGMTGVLSVGATANGNVNVDLVGDAPTSFPSEFLITVTNTDRNDIKSSFAGYGEVSIDLGAPGTQVYSTKMNGAYGTKTGTSMSAPHVTGAVAQMFSLADASFMTAYHNDPAGMALVIKQYILNGTDPLPSLNGITVSGGRLNIYNSARLMMNPDISFDPMSILKVMPPNHQDSVSLGFTNNSAGTLNYNITYPENPGWLTLNGQLSGTLAGYASADVMVHFNSDGSPADTLFAYISFNYGTEGLFQVPVHLIVDPNVGVEEQGSGEAGKRGSLEVWPNPAREMLNIECWMLNAGNHYYVVIYNSAGRQVDKIRLNSGNEKLKLNVESYNPGIYFAIISDGQTAITSKKFLISR